MSLFTVDSSLVPAFEAWALNASTRGKSMEQSLKKAMRFAIDFAIARTPKGDRAKIKADLAKLSQEYAVVTESARRKRSRSKAAETWRGTLAAAIVFRLNYMQARTEAHAKSPAFYQKVNRFVNARQYAANLHAAGWKPAQRVLHGSPAGAALPTFRRHPPGSVPQMTLSDTTASILVENWASAAEVPGRPAPLGISGILGDKLLEILPDLQKLFEKFLAEDLLRAAEKANLRVKKL